jgi:diaminopimelate epimerase
MREIAFQKYSVYGNTFVLIDETRGAILSESEKSRLAGYATNAHFGIGADNLIVVQPCTPEVLQSINGDRRFWPQDISCREATFVFRMFEPNGDEAFSCGNGAMCVADHLNRTQGIRSCRILHQIPTDFPNVMSIGLEPSSGMAWANLGCPTRLPASMSHIDTADGPAGYFSQIRDVPLTLQNLHLNGKKSEITLNITGYLIFAGEPHLVIYTDSGFSARHLTRALFLESCDLESQSVDTNPDANQSCWLLHHIGSRINRTFASVFPFGINVDFVRMGQSENIIEFRCYERGINHETLACGTGAVAVSAVSHGLGLCQGDETLVWPHRCRWYYPDSQFTVKRNETDWYVYGSPCRLYRGYLPLL